METASTRTSTTDIYDKNWAASEFEAERNDLFDELLDLMFTRQGGSKVGGVRED